MRTLANLCSMNCDELTVHYSNIFNDHDGTVSLERADLKEAAELILRSRRITLTFREAQQFEEHFIKVKSKIRKTFYTRATFEFSNVKKAMIYVLHYIVRKRTACRHVKQSLKKNAGFRVFAVDMGLIINKLITLEVLRTERRVKRSASS